MNSHDTSFGTSPESDKDHEIISIKSPRLDAIEKLYVKAFLSKLSHSYAHSVVAPDLVNHLNDNQFSRRENVKFHIQKGLQERMEAMELDTNKIIERMYIEATREDKGASHNARIQALTMLGKHLGLFKDKEKEDSSVTIQVISYGSTDPVVITKEPSESINDLEEANTIEGIEMISYDLPNSHSSIDSIDSIDEMEDLNG